MSVRIQASIVARKLKQRGLLDAAHRAAERFHVTVEAMLGRDRHKSASAARHALWAEIYDLDLLSLPELGEVFDRDHTTILAGVRKHLAVTVARTQPSANAEKCA
jgi:chromosomal replication initiation ATPase DnaA